MEKHLRSLTPVLLYAVLSFAVLLIYSSSTSPLWDKCTGDQTIFSVIGWNWANGMLPYETAWDSKGPIIFFANMLGHLFGSGETGTFFIQIVNMTAVLWLTDRLLRRFCQPRMAVTLTMFFLLGWLTDSSRGNIVSDYTLILAVPSVLLTYEYTLGFSKHQYAVPGKTAFVCGLFMAACLLSRATDFMVMAVAMFMVLCLLIWKGLWRNIVGSALWIVGGFLTLFIPFAAYFAAHGLFGEMWYAMFTYNVEYAMTSHIADMEQSAFMPLYHAVWSFCLIAPVMAAVVAIIMKSRVGTALFWGIASGSALLWMMNSYANASYNICYMPLLLVALMELSHLRTAKVARYALYAVCAVVVGGFLNSTRTYFLQMNSADKKRDSLMRMVKDIPQKDTFAALNFDGIVYLKSERHPTYRFFSFQDWAISNGKSLRSKVRRCFEEGNAQWILASDYDRSNVRDIIDRRYTLVKEDRENGLKLFRLKERQ